MTKPTIEQIRDALAAIDSATCYRETYQAIAKYRDATNPAAIREVLAHIEAQDAEITRLQKLAQAVLDRWDSPAWEWHKHGPTADLMAALRAALITTTKDPS